MFCGFEFYFLGAADLDSVAIRVVAWVVISSDGVAVGALIIKCCCCWFCVPFVWVMLLWVLLL